MRDEVVVSGSGSTSSGWAVPADGVEVARGVLDSAVDSQHEEMWIYPRTKGYPSFLQKIPVCRCSAASTGIFRLFASAWAVPRVGITQ